MTDLKSSTLRRLERTGGHSHPLKAMEWLSRADIEPLTEQPAAVVLREIERVWRARLCISESKGQVIEGARELLAILAQMDPRIKLRQISFSSPRAMANVFFEKRSGKYVGWVLFGATAAREELRRAS